jgi:hypothetical protein
MENQNKQIYTPEEMPFVESLVLAMTGLSMYDIPEEKKFLINDCITIYKTFVEQYVQEKFGDRSAMQIKSATVYGNPSLNEDTELYDQYEDAYSSFLTQLAGRKKI